MCDPVSLLAVGTGVAVASSVTEGIAASNAASANASLRRNEANQTRQMTALNETTKRRQTERVLRQQVVDQVAAGSDPTSGTSLDQAFFSARNADLDIQRIRLGGELKANSLENRANFADAEASNAIVFSAFSAGANLLRGGRELRALE